MTATELFSEDRSAEVVGASFDKTADPRLREIMTALVRHLHAFVKDVEPTVDEWARAIDFLTRTGQMCSDVRQEFILLSDVLGVSMLVETINHRAGGRHRVHRGRALPHGGLAATRPGRDIALDGKGEPCLVTGRVTGTRRHTAGRRDVDVWQANADGYYDVQQPGVQPERNLRGLFTTDADGASCSAPIVPAHYPIPDDGPVGRAARGRPDGIRTGRHMCTSTSGRGLSSAGHPSVRRGHPLRRLGCGLRGQGQPGAGVPGGRRRRPGR